MNKFGTLKLKVLQKLTEAYANGNKDEIKDILKIVTSDKNFKDMYLFYEDIENKHIENISEAREYVEDIEPIIKEKSRKISKFCKSLNETLSDVNVSENELYSTIDVLLENYTLRNIDKRIRAKTKLIDYLTKKKDTQNPIGTVFTTNENLLHTVLANNFNTLYDEMLNEEQKEELKKILAITNEELETNFKTLKTEVHEKLTNLLSEEKSGDVVNKLNDAISQLTTMDVSKFNYYKLTQLKNGL